MSSVQSSNLALAGTDDLINQRELRDLKRALSQINRTTREARSTEETRKQDNACKE
jgi:hypothetical protein